MEELIDLAHLHDFIIVSDECYSELYYDDKNIPGSLLAVAQRVSQRKGKRPFERCLSFHSLSNARICQDCVAVSSLAIAN